MEPLFLKGVFQEKIWGGDKLQKEFGYEIPSDKTGELWAISAHPNGPATVSSGVYAGKTLMELWDEHRELFGNQEGRTFPLLTKIIDAHNDLSVQVHPDDDYALANEGELGKTECWYVLDAEPGSKIIYGHTATTKEELRELIEAGRWRDLLEETEVQVGDFFYIPSGTVHALGSGVMVLEIQQSSDTTYRLYDYERVDNEGNLRELHIDQSIDVTTIPHQQEIFDPVVDPVENGTLTTLIANEFFSVFKWEIKGAVPFTQESLYILASVVAGAGKLMIDHQEYPLKKGDHFILPHGIKEWTIEGDLEIIASHS